jgi:Na+/H+-dicarboxylate symporter
MDIYFRIPLTIRILSALGLGFILGLLLNLLADDNGLRLFLVEGVFFVGGEIFFRALQLLVVPVVLTTLICGTASLDSIRKVGTIGGKALGLYLLTTAIAICIALSVALIIKPGSGFQLEADPQFEARTAEGFAQVLINLFPRNPFSAMAEGNMLQIIIFAVLFGLALTMAGKPGEPVLRLLESLQTVVLKLVTIVMELAPIGVLCLIARVFATQGFDVFGNLLLYFLTVLGVLIFHGLVIYPLLLTLLARLNPRPFLRKMMTAQAFAFSTASSNATLPVTLRTVEERLGVKNSVASFTVPLGATINMDGTAIMQGVATVFIAQIYGIDLTAAQILSVVLMATLASVGTAGVPGVGLILLAAVLNQVGLPVEAIGIILAVDRILDMVRTAVNITGDAAVTTVVAKSEGALNEITYNEKHS